MLTQERERKREREKKRKNNFLSKRTRHKEKKIDKKIWQKDRQQKIVKNIKSRNLYSFYQKVYIKVYKNLLE